MYELKKIRDRIYCMDFDKRYDLAMHFLRYQEFQESPTYRGQSFTFFEFMRNYSLKNKNVFAYAKDWSGFNIPGNVIRKVFKQGISDQNQYDDVMLDVYTQISNVEGDDNFYLIGVHHEKKRNRTQLLGHEICHGLYNTDELFKIRMDQALSNLSPKVEKYMEKVFKDWGYNKAVWQDEKQAYLATGLDEELNKPLVQRARKPFKEIFKLYDMGKKK